MAIFIAQCPYCLIEKMSFISNSVVIREQHFALLRICASSFCPNCRKVVGVWAEFHPHRGNPLHGCESLNKSPQTFEDIGYEVTHVWPMIQQDVPPDHLPSEITRVFSQAEGCSRRSANDAANIMYRRCIELALKERIPGESGTLAAMINRFRDKGGITKEVAEWAHLVRLIANEAAHDPGEPNPADVEDLASFTRVFLEYIYTLPERVRMRLEAKGAK